MQAQESGERLEVQDRVLYALDGLQPHCSPATHRDSALALATLCASRRSRTAVRSGLTSRHACLCVHVRLLFFL